MVVLDVLRMFNSPRLYWVYTRAANSAPHTGFPYTANGAESWGQGVLTWMKVLLSLGLYTSPFYFPWLLRRAELRQNPRGIFDLMFLVSCVYAVGLLIRACGRRANPVYNDFYQVYRDCAMNFTAENKTILAKYDFEFWAWPVEFNATRKANKTFLPAPALTESILDIPQKFLGWAMINSFGFKMIYPGSVATLQYFMGPSISENRANLVKKGGVRYKICTEDKNHIDSMFFDKRGTNELGSKLVIVCEGNAGFYEAGMLTIPLDIGYSVIGWNHPGFWGSTGSPFPSQEAHAVDAVMQFAQSYLGFEEEDIIVYGWSIGGFTATWLGMNYPNIHALILDATFDNITPLAVNSMPHFLEGTVRQTVKHFFNLAVSEQLSKYDGPIKLIRRTRDEIISTDPTREMATNRGNYLLLSLLQKRHPVLFTEEEVEAQLMAYLSRDQSGQEEIIGSRNMDSIQTEQLLMKLEPGKNLPIDDKINLALYLARFYMSELESTHCTPLPASLFKIPKPLGKTIGQKDE